MGYKIFGVAQLHSFQAGGESESPADLRSWIPMAVAQGAAPEQGAAVWRCPVLAEIPGMLTADEMRRADRYQSEAARRCFIAGRTLIRSLAGAALGVEPRAVGLALDAKGKPFVGGGSFCFNISHSGTWVAAVVARQPVGIDIEDVEREGNWRGIARRYFAEDEMGFLERLAEPERRRAFIRHWVCKEAALKCAGTGISDSLNQTLCVREGGAIRCVCSEGREYSIVEFACGDRFAGAVASLAPIGEVQLYDAVWG
jgi:4'-phosphopantetheinyl transferase